ncbi:hypothetical protein BSTEL_2020 [Bifidobacterium stellenboschense]|uniref:Uncharacterized protein n=1 Tax=Bifidobacterium stellenboschense TaxID=762211 RepID=A0A087D976_9BIFI|nr:hypothetical protein BSTEL_2020 [Bifidobacterium stellenboschense]
MKTTERHTAHRPTSIPDEATMRYRESPIGTGRYPGRNGPSPTVRALTGIGSGPADEDDYRRHLAEKSR